jgi:uncharacterized iron-regulated membrane protein
MLWADTRHDAVAPPASGGGRLPIETLLAGVQAAQPDAALTTVTVRADPQAPVAVGGGGRTLYVHPYNGAILGEGALGLRRFFRVVTDVHRTLGLKDAVRPLGRAITGAANLAFLFIVMSGLVLWWPRRLAQLRSVTMFNGRLRGKARDFNWHNVIGSWSAVPLIVVLLGSVLISYPWATNLVYRAVGETPPARREAGPGGAPGARRGQNARADERGRPAGERQAERNRENRIAGIDRLWTRAEQQVAGWRSVSLRLPAQGDARAVFTIDQGTGGQPQKRATLTLDRNTAGVVEWEPFTSLSTGRQVRSWLRFAHTGEVYGLPGQTIAGAVSLGGAVLVYTGLALAFRRFLAWRARSRRSTGVHAVDDPVVLRLAKGEIPLPPLELCVARSHLRHMPRLPDASRGGQRTAHCNLARIEPELLLRELTERAVERPFVYRGPDVRDASAVQIGERYAVTSEHRVDRARVGQSGIDVRDGCDGRPRRCTGA